LQPIQKGIHKMSNMKTIIFICCASLLFLITCTKKNSEPTERPRETEILDSLVLLPEGTEAVEIAIDPNTKFQTIDNFGASDCWSGQFAGNWPTSKTTQMADWLFSMDTTNNGQPLGIGLSAWRFNIGTGSAEQGNESGIADEWRRTSGFLQADGSYNWEKQSGQRNLLTAAHDRGVEQFIGFTNSPPVNFTKTGKAYGSSADPENIATDKLEDFADFLVEVVGGLKERTGVELTYLSPVNEPQWDWTHGGQEGCYMTNSTYRQLVEALDNKLTLSNGINTKIMVSEAGKWTYLYSEGSTVGNQIAYFFGPGSPVNNAPNLAKIAAGHSYYSTTPTTTMIDIREQVWQKASLINNMKVWSTEYCPLGDGDLTALGWNDWHKDLGMDVALYVAQIVYHDLVYANASAWQWWLAISPYDYPDGLIYVSKDKTNGTYSDSKLMWVLGNYSRFVRPGAQRVKAEQSSQDLFVSAFVHETDQTFSIVLVNRSENPVPVKLKLDGNVSASVKPYITSGKDTHKLMPMKSIDVSNAFEMPPLSVITFNRNF